MNRGQVAARVRENKEKHPERYCSAKNCLWSVASGKCPKHPTAAIHLGRWSGGQVIDPIMPDFEEVSA